MSSKRYTEAFKVEAVKQVTERGQAVSEVASRLGVSIHSLYLWQKQYGKSAAKRGADADQAAQLRSVKSELRRVTKERDILKKSAVSSIGQRDVWRAACASERLLCVDAGSGKSARSGEPASECVDEAGMDRQRRRVRLSKGARRPAQAWRELWRASSGAPHAWAGLRAQVGYRRRRPGATGPAALAAPNLLDRHFTVDAPNTHWVTDITYLRTVEGWLSLAVGHRSLLAQGSGLGHATHAACRPGTGCPADGGVAT